MNYQYEEAKLSAEEIAEIYRNTEASRLNNVIGQVCAEEMKPERVRNCSTGLIMGPPCYVCNDTDATQDEIDQALEAGLSGIPRRLQSQLSFRLSRPD